MPILISRSILQNFQSPKNGNFDLLKFDLMIIPPERERKEVEIERKKIDKQQLFSLLVSSV
jgi:hypothetical protein